jgi:hypothetical protein
LRVEVARSFYLRLLHARVMILQARFNRPSNLFWKHWNKDIVRRSTMNRNRIKTAAVLCRSHEAFRVQSDPFDRKQV